MAIKCCLGCVAPKRNPWCHSHCAEYITEKAQYEEEKAAANRKKAVGKSIYVQKQNGVLRAHKARKCKKGK